MTDLDTVSGSLAELTPSGWTIREQVEDSCCQGGAVTSALKRDLTTTMQTAAFPQGIKWCVISYRLLPGATAVANQFAKFVINAASDADATGKLATDGAFIAIAQGDDWSFSGADNDDPIYRIDYISEAAVGAEKTIFQIVGGV